MITLHSVNLMYLQEPCWALASYDSGCKLLIAKEPGCCSYKCPFYKPINCRDWVRIEDKDGINLIPPEEAYGKAFRER